MSDNTGHDRHIYKNGWSGGGSLHATFHPSPKYGGRSRGGGGEEGKRRGMCCLLCIVQTARPIGGCLLPFLPDLLLYGLIHAELMLKYPKLMCISLSQD